MPEYLGWFFPIRGVGSEANTRPPQNIELLVAAQERAIVARETEIRTTVAAHLGRPEFKHITTGLELK